MSSQFIIVSCDIIAHSSEASLNVQQDRVKAINDIVHEIAREHDHWACGGDGGHLLLSGADAPARAISLLAALRNWSLQARVRLRISSNTGEVTFVQGADGRPVAVGPGINLAGRLIDLSDATCVIVTDSCRNLLQAVAPPGVEFHDCRTVTPRHFESTRLYLFSSAGGFRSVWPECPLNDDRECLTIALKSGNAIQTLLYAKRLLEINPNEPRALDTLQQIASGAIPVRTQSLADDLIRDGLLGEDFLRVAQLIDRTNGDVLCRFQDDGETLFVILKGQIAGYLPPPAGGIPNTTGAASFHLSAGALVGELAFVLKRKRTATLVCEGDVSLLAFDYNELLRHQDDPQMRDRIDRLIMEKVQARVFENLWKASPFFNGPNSGIFKPTDRNSLNKYARLWSTPAGQSEISTDDPVFEAHAMHFLVSGILEEPATGRLLDGANFPLLFAKLPPDFHAPADTYRIREDTRVLTIAAKGFEMLGSRVLEKMVQQLRDHFGGGAHATPASPPPSKTASVDGVLNCYFTSKNCAGNVVFVHGLDGDAVQSWQSKGAADSWTKWLGEDLERVCVWTIGYDSKSSAWRGHSMPVFDRATNVLARLEAGGLLDRPLVFVCHSLGGLLVKEMLRVAHDSGNPEWKALITSTRGIAFLSTPHSGSDVAIWVKKFGALLRPTESVDELQYNDTRLRELNMWYSNNAPTIGIRTLAFCEKRPVSGLLVVVDESSANPHIPGVLPIPMDEDHISICKPATRNHLVYVQVKRFIEKALNLAH
ncbi:MAG TPA: cyclic nucleotide-binding domain-containing protein [Phycisphaerae bacterium]|nr:cyclic nucleotide-binding domain-containing protein [Phycisphaerae bacterium]